MNAQTVKKRVDLRFPQRVVLAAVFGVTTRLGEDKTRGNKWTRSAAFKNCEVQCRTRKSTARRSSCELMLRAALGEIDLNWGDS